MDRSPYLAQALQAMSAAPQAMPAGPQMDPAQMAALAQNAQAYRTQNPGQSYVGHNLMQAGRNVMGAPGRVAGGLGNLARTLGVGAPDPMRGLT